MTKKHNLATCVASLAAGFGILAGTAATAQEGPGESARRAAEAAERSRTEARRAADAQVNRQNLHNVSIHNSQMGQLNSPPTPHVGKPSGGGGAARGRAPGVR